MRRGQPNPHHGKSWNSWDFPGSWGAGQYGTGAVNDATRFGNGQ